MLLETVRVWENLPDLIDALITELAIPVCVKREAAVGNNRYTGGESEKQNPSLLFPLLQLTRWFGKDCKLISKHMHMHRVRQFVYPVLSSSYVSLCVFCLSLFCFLQWTLENTDALSSVNLARIVSASRESILLCLFLAKNEKRKRRCSRGYRMASQKVLLFSNSHFSKKGRNFNCICVWVSFLWVCEPVTGVLIYERKNLSQGIDLFLSLTVFHAGDTTGDPFAGPSVGKSRHPSLLLLLLSSLLRVKDA